MWDDNKSSDSNLFMISDWFTKFAHSEAVVGIILRLWWTLINSISYWEEGDIEAIKDHYFSGTNCHHKGAKCTNEYGE